jgi:hypothetical protein
MKRSPRLPRMDKRTLVHAGTPIFDSVISDLKFNPSDGWTEPTGQHATPATVAKQVRQRRKTVG